MKEDLSMELTRPTQEETSQFERQRPSSISYRPGFIQTSQTLSMRLSLGLLGVFLSTLGVKNRGVSRFVLSSLGIALLIKAATRKTLTDLLSVFLSPTIRLQRSIDVFAATEDVYDFLKDFSRFPKFMSFIESVDINQHGGLHWTAQAPAHLKVEWDSQITSLVPNQLISWKSIPGSLITNEGQIRIRPLSPDLTRIEVELTFAPAAGVFGYAIVSFLGYDPKSKIDQDLQYLKSILENSIKKSA
jgi:uncharacterized membrane protein